MEATAAHRVNTIEDCSDVWGAWKRQEKFAAQCIALVLQLHRSRRPVGRRRRFVGSDVASSVTPPLPVRRNTARDAASTLKGQTRGLVKPR